MTLGEAQDAASMEDVCQIGRITQTGERLSVLPSIVKRTGLGAQEWRYYLFPDICHIPPLLT